MSLKYFESFMGLWNTNFTFRSLASDFAISGCGGGDVAGGGGAGTRGCTLEQEYLSTNVTIRLNKHRVRPDQSLDVNTKSKAQSECI